MQPDIVAAMIAAFTGEWNRLAVEAGAQAEAQQREFQAVERKIENLLDALADGIRTPNLATLYQAASPASNRPSPATTAPKPSKPPAPSSTKS